MLILLVLSGLIALLGCTALLRAGEESSRKYWQLHVPQRFHIGHVPRLGGAGVGGGGEAGVGWVGVGAAFRGRDNL